VNKKLRASDAEYSVVPSPQQPTPSDVLQAYKEKPINLEALFSGGNALGVPPTFFFDHAHRVLTAKPITKERLRPPM
jgi:hypothetical protein